MMALIFLLLLVAVLFAVFGKRNWAIGLLIITLVLAGFWFAHHATSHLNIIL